MRAIQDNEATAARRRIMLSIVDDTTNAAAWAGSVTGVKAQLSANGGTETPSTNDIVRVGGTLHYVELTQAEADRTAGDLVVARVPAASGRREAIGSAVIFADNIYAAAPTDTTIATQVASTLAGAGGATAREAFADTFLGRAVAGGANGGRTVARALKKLVNRWTRVGTTLTVYEDNDTTPAFSETLTVDASASAVTGGDPT